jgi:hypothetical protein
MTSEQILVTVHTGRRTCAVQIGAPRVARATFVSLMLALFGLISPGLETVEAQAPKRASGVAQKEKADAGWGEAGGGLRARIVAVAPDTDEQQPDIAAAKRVSQYADSEDVTLLVELKNVSDQPIALQGTRYGNTVSQPWPGKSASDAFAPHLFDCEFFDRQGKPIERPARQTLDVDLMLSLSSGSAETVQPGKSLVVLIRPTRWDAAQSRQFAAGEFQVRVSYHGPTKKVIEEIRRHWPDQPLTRVWSGNVVSEKIAFTVTGDPKAKALDLVWGKPENGLRAAVEFRNAAGTPRAKRDTAAAIFPYGARLAPFIHVENVSDREISFWSETWRQDDGVTLIDSDDKETPVNHPWYSGLPRLELFTLRPGQTAILSCLALGIAGNKASADEFTHPITPFVVPEPGKYRLRYEVHFGRIQRQDNAGKKIIPRDGDFTGTLVTGEAPITVREHEKDDDPPTFIGRLEFHGPDGKPPKEGRYEIFIQGGGNELKRGSLQGVPVEIPECPFEPLMVNIRAAGFEETRFYDVRLKSDSVTPLALTPAQPLRFRLVTRDGEPVVGAEVRRFNRSKAKASAGPYPTAGLKGEVWGVSNARGEVVLDMLQKIDPRDDALGNNIYFFYVEPVAHAPLFIGPVEAGDNLGDVKVGPFLDASGEIRGTPEELAAFDAEWDQPAPMKRGNGETEWEYAVSAKLETVRDGEKLKFQLTDLRPGKLRIVSRFKRGGKPVSHTYSRREPNEDDVVFEIDLQEGRDDLVVTNKK